MAILFKEFNTLNVFFMIHHVLLNFSACILRFFTSYLPYIDILPFFLVCQLVCVIAHIFSMRSINFRVVSRCRFVFLLAFVRCLDFVLASLSNSVHICVVVNACIDFPITLSHVYISHFYHLFHSLDMHAFNDVHCTIVLLQCYK